MARNTDAQQLHLETPAARLPEQSGRRTSRSPRDAVRPWSEARTRRGASTRSAADLLGTPGALLTRTHLRQLGLERRAIDAIFRALPVVALPGYSRPMVRAEQYLELVERYTYRDDRVRSCRA
jgi:hypothetical protein